MSRSLQTNNPTVVAAFNRALLHQLLIVLAAPGRAGRGVEPPAAIPVPPGARHRRDRRLTADTHPDPEPLGRRILRIGFGGPVDLRRAVAGPVGDGPGPARPPCSARRPKGSPAWVHSLVNVGVTTWWDHPFTGRGVGGLDPARDRRSPPGCPPGSVVPRRRLLSVGWALVVWSFGEAFGAILAPGAHPGPSGHRAAAPLRRGRRPAGPARAVVEGAGGSGPLPRVGGGGRGFLLGMVVLQAWPGRGFWQGRGSAPRPRAPSPPWSRRWPPTRQPGFLSGVGAPFGSFDAAHGWGVNLSLVVALAADRGGPGERSPRPRAGGWFWRLVVSSWPTGCWSRTSASWAGRHRPELDGPAFSPAGGGRGPPPCCDARFPG